MNFLFRFNKTIGISILSQWLNGKDVLVFEASLCTGDCSALLKWYEDDLLVKLFGEDAILNYSYDVFHWFKKYNLKGKGFLRLLSNHSIKLDSVEESAAVEYLSSVSSLELKNVHLDNVKCVRNAFSTLQELFILFNANNKDIINFAVPLCHNLRVCHLTSPTDDNIIRQVCYNCPELKSLIVYYHATIGRVALLGILVHARKLEHLELYGSTFGITEGAIFAVHSRNLKSLITPGLLFRSGYDGSKLQQLRIGSMDNVESTYNALKLCTSLTNLTLQGWKASWMHPLGLLFGTYKQLKTVRLDLLDKSDYEYEILDIVKKCTTLESLAIVGLVVPLSVMSFRTIAKCLPHLTSFTYRGCEEVYDDDIVTVIKSCNQLTEIDISCNELLGDASVIAIAQHCKGLKTLNISRTEVTDEGLIALSGSCRRLSVLNVNNCKNISSKGVNEVMKWLPVTTIEYRGCPNVKL